MAELIRAADLPETQGEELELICLEGGQLKRKNAAGIGAASNYIIRVPAEEMNMDEDNGTINVTLSESYDNFAPVIYNGGNVVLDLSASELSGGNMVCAYPIFWGFMDNTLVGIGSMGPNTVTAYCTNGSWTPPAE